LMRHYLYGAGTPQDDAKAIEAFDTAVGYWSDAADAPPADLVALVRKRADEAELLLAELFRNGIGVEVDPEAALALERKAAAQGLAEAEMALATHYLD